MSKFFRSASNSSSSSGSCDSNYFSSDEVDPQKKTQENYRYETPPPKQRIVPVNDPDMAWEILKSTQRFEKVPIKQLPYEKSKKEERWLRVACISDTHGRHKDVMIPKCDVLLHAGDLTMTGLANSFQNIQSWFLDQLKMKKVKQQILFIAGNHDLTLHHDHYQHVWSRFHSQKADTRLSQQIITSHNNHNITYLQDQSFQLSHDDGNNPTLHVYGSPWQPEFFNWAFNMDRSKLREQVWSKIPSCTDILMTHGPPLGRGDLLYNHVNRVGCVDLLREVQSRIRPKLHVFGHIHESHGVSYDGTTLFVNASSVHSGTVYNIRNQVVVVDIPLFDNDDADDSSLPAHVVQPPSHHPTIQSHHDLIQWIQQYKDDYESILPYFQQQPISIHDLIRTRLDDDEDAHNHFQSLCDQLGLHRKPMLKETLNRIRMQLIAESYGTTW